MTVGEMGMKYAIHNENEIRGFFGPYYWLSNFAKCDIEYNGLKFTNVEAAYQAQKCPERASEFINLNGSQSKDLGNNVPLRSDWDNDKRSVMMALTIRKYSAPNLELIQKLKDTGIAHIEETNHWNDRYWGVDYKTGKGHNYMGKIIMNTRNIIREIDTRGTHPRK